MFLIIGYIIVLGSVLGGYLPHGSFDILVQPLEVLIIFGAAFGAFLTANPLNVVKRSFSYTLRAMKGPKKKVAYVELLTCLYAIFRLAKSKGDLALESHVENPESSSLFANFPILTKDHHALEFMCDYLRLLTLGTTNPYELEAVIDQELETHHEEEHAVSDAVQTVGDGLPALGIVAAVLGVIVTMSSVTEPPEILGGLIAAALVGTFLGILGAYGFVAPTASIIKNTVDTDAKYYTCIKAALIGHMQGYAPQVSVEFARKSLPHGLRPSFKELDEALQNAPTA
ncbi:MULTISPECIES: flagellar motor stator protein MotA [Thalassospira]|uniref:Flagellar motor stator protein MotA n=4 Tax=Thalassospira TaxID=168934 RepID=A0A3D5NEY6_9PROT|nr:MULTISPECIES: flagellar motor stator protein MotA [Thalassospira]PKR59518.1 flagellar motor stator protein MotA [Thalassospira lohafexi]HCW69268.1 flagellar motor stator protein MotA [Thalassospira lucentensis]